MSKIINSKEEKDKKRSAIISLVLHSLLFLLFFLPLIKVDPPKEIGGILVSFGDPDAGYDALFENVEEVTTSEEATASGGTSSESEDVNSKDRVEEAPIAAKEKTVQKKETPNTNNTKNQADVIAKNKAEADRKAKEAAAKADADRVAKEKTEFDNKKKKFSDLLGGGKGNNNNKGNQGTEKGDPNGNVLSGMSKGSGKVGGGLSGRGVEFEPTFADNSQKTGKVSLSICVNNDGKVTKADFTQKGSTTSDAYLIDLARKTALKYRFSKSDIESQCGTVTVDFKVQ
jgi:membrane protein involved in colicin uptake